MRTKDIGNYLTIALLACTGIFSDAQGASWIWHRADANPDSIKEPRFFRYAFTVPGGWKSAVFEMSVDNEGTAYLNGEKIASTRDWQRPAQVDVAARLKQGRNVLAIRAGNRGGIAGLVARLKLQRHHGPEPTIETDGQWLSAETSQEGWMDPSFDDSKWERSVVLKPLGDQPWGDVFKQPEATPADAIQVPNGFKVEQVLSAARHQGSWIAMTFDDRGRVILSPQSDQDPMLRIDSLDAGQVKVHAFTESRIRHAMGLLYAHDSLYINGHGPKGTGLYRWVDDNRDDAWTDDETRFLKAIRGEGEHGYHGLRLGPDGMIYMMNGNHTRIPEGILHTSAHQHYAEDHLLPRQWDANGHAAGVLAPGGYIVRTDAEGKTWELLLAGFRNAYDFDFNGDGEMFTFDSDMEWDWGTPWYRPTRVIHAVTGGEYGWRSGTSKWPDYYEDSLPATIDIGIGSPTGVCFGYGTAFPERYQRALYVMDWSYGRIFAVHLQPDGASYFASKEPFVTGRPLNVADMEVGPDGALYFIIGGRGTQSGLYRVTYSGPESTERVSARSQQETDARLLRKKLESYHGREHAQAIPFAWPHLRSPDRWIRYAARIAIESQPVDQWADKALEEEHMQGSLSGMLALARRGGATWQPALLARLGERVSPEMSEDTLLQAVRILQLACIRMGAPETEMLEELRGAVAAFYPSPHARANKELCRVAVYLKTPDVIEKTLTLVEESKHIEDQLHYIFCLRNIRSGWTLEERRRYFSWFNQNLAAAQHPSRLLSWFLQAGRNFSYGASFNKFLGNIKKEAQEGLSDAEATALRDILEGGQMTAKDQAPNPILTRSEFTEWTMQEVEAALDRVGSGRDFQRGRLAYEASQCAACHRFGNEGGSVGPELTAIGSRFSSRDILDSIMNPSRVLSEQYVYEKILTSENESFVGRIVGENDSTIELLENPYSEIRTRIPKDQIKTREHSKVSPMPEGLLQVLKLEEILDLIAYLESGGDPNTKHFKE